MEALLPGDYQCVSKPSSRSMKENNPHIYDLSLEQTQNYQKRFHKELSSRSASIPLDNSHL